MKHIKQWNCYLYQLLPTSGQWSIIFCINKDINYIISNTLCIHTLEYGTLHKVEGPWYTFDEEQMGLTPNEYLWDLFRDVIWIIWKYKTHDENSI